MLMSYGALEFAYAEPIAAALVSNPEFRTWVLSRTRFGQRASGARLLHEEMLARRGKAANWWRSHYTHKCTCDGCSGRETDLLAVFELSDGRRVAIHFEVKQPTDVFHAGQGHSYALRAACWAANPPRAVVAHDDATTILLCSAGKLASYGDEALAFETVGHVWRRLVCALR